MSTIIRAATFNLKNPGFIPGKNDWKHRRELLFDTFRTLNADIVGVQELTPRMRLELMSELSQYNAVGRARGGIFNEHSDIMVRSGLKVDFENTFPLSRGRSGRLYSLASPLAWIFPRICTVAEVTVGSRRIRVFNTHLDVSSERARLFQLGIICRSIDEYSRTDPLPTILTGDFNSLPASRTVRLLEAGFGYDGVKLRNITGELDGGTFHFFRGGKGSRVIDYIFTSPDFLPLDLNVIRDGRDGLYPSDHYPLIAELALGD